MGTSTPYLKPTKRFLYPTATVEIDQKLVLFLGGSGVCAALGGGNDAILINTNQGVAAKGWQEELAKREIATAAPLVLLSQSAEFSGGVALSADATKIYHAGNLRLPSEQVNQRFFHVEEELQIEVSGEAVQLIPLENCVTGSDLAVFLPSRSMLFLGPLFYNRIHPIVRFGEDLNPEKWIRTLRELMSRFKPEIIVPGEGDLANADDVEQFISYLVALTDTAVEFSYCRERFDWAEIPSLTSLEENFDMLRSRKKTHTTLRERN